MSDGMTMKQFVMQDFWRELEAYKKALREKKDIVVRSVLINSACNGVAQHVNMTRYKECKRIVNRAFRNGGID